jgi:HemK-like putative methylase
MIKSKQKNLVVFIVYIQVIVAKTETVKDQLMDLYKTNQIQVVMRVLCHGFVSTTDMATLFHPEINKIDEEAECIMPSHIIKQLTIVSQTPSNNAQYISRLDLELHTPASNTLLRKLFYFHSKHPIIGNSNYTRPLKANRDKGLCAALLSVSFMHPVLENTLIQVKQEEPAKFGVMCDREAKFHQNKLDRESEEIKKSGVLTIDLAERKEGQLLAYMLGQKEFCGHTFRITQDCLIPRASSETLVHAAVTALNKQPIRQFRIVDIGTGCGNLLISILLQMPAATGVGIDISEAALQVAKENCAQLLLNGDKKAVWRLQDMSTLDDDKDLFDLLVCNPPYLDLEKVSKRKEQMVALEQEPAEALFAADNGYAWYHVLSQKALAIVKKDGCVVLECGKGMMAKVLEIWSDWEQDASYKDVQGWDRCLVLKRKM